MCAAAGFHAQLLRLPIEQPPQNIQTDIKAPLNSSVFLRKTGESYKPLVSKTFAAHRTHRSLNGRVYRRNASYKRQNFLTCAAYMTRSQKRRATRVK
jgi:hypothetical protein